MIEKVVLDYLKENLNVYVGMSEPEEESQRYVIIEKTGSSSTDFINSATIAIKSYAESLYEAVTLNEAVKEAMDKIIRHCDISKSKLNTDYNFTDKTKKRYRYQAVYDLVY